MKKVPKVIPTLFISSFVIAMLVAFMTLFIQYTQIETKVIALAKNEVKYLIKDLKKEQDMHNSAFILEQTNFLFISLYNQYNQLVFMKERSEYKKIRKELREIDHHIVTNNSAGRQERIIHNQIQNRFYFEFKIPIVSSNFRGYVKGIYQISDAEIEIIYENIFYFILISVMIVFVTTLLLYPIIVYLNRAYLLESKKLLHANLEIISVLGGAIAKRDSETNAHNYRVTLYAIAFGEKLGLDKKMMVGLIKGAFLHDVGKIGVSDTILLKPSQLSKEEFSLMKKHVDYGVDIISKSDWLLDAVDVVAYHHERYDGSGYNIGLKGKKIPLGARIFMICDVFDALSSVRPYKKAIPVREVIGMIHKRAGTHFDPELVPVFLSFIQEKYGELVSMESEEDLKKMLSEKLHYFSM